MANFNRVILAGNITRDIELRYIPSGIAVTDITLAVNDKRKTQSGEVIEETTFVDVTLWGRTAEVASEYLSKGSSILIEGRLKLDTWETEGQKRYKLRVVCERMQMLSPRGSSGGGGGGQDRPPRQYDESEYSHSSSTGVAESSRGTPAGPPEDDIPF
ncbi:MAG: single-stranded DNA-binding protein [Pirellulaceae bacterium]|nr:single-stranded DNA-binding protein [Pirellulaceae bacterium]